MPLLMLSSLLFQWRWPSTAWLLQLYWTLEPGGGLLYQDSSKTDILPTYSLGVGVLIAHQGQSVLWWRCWGTQAHVPWTMESDLLRVMERTSSYRHRAAPQMSSSTACWLHTGLSCCPQSSHLPQTAGQMFYICTYIRQITIIRCMLHLLYVI